MIDFCMPDTDAAKPSASDAAWVSPPEPTVRPFSLIFSAKSIEASSAGPLSTACARLGLPYDKSKLASEPRFLRAAGAE